MHEATPEQSRAAITFMLQAPESRRFECKRVSGNMVGKALVTICAMANTEGGSLLLGMEDPAKAKGIARLYGIEENPEAVDELLRKLATHLQPPVEDVKLRDRSGALLGHVLFFSKSIDSKYKVMARLQFLLAEFISRLTMLIVRCA